MRFSRLIILILLLILNQTVHSSAISIKIEIRFGEAMINLIINHLKDNDYELVRSYKDKRERQILNEQDVNYLKTKLNNIKLFNHELDKCPRDNLYIEIIENNVTYKNKACLSLIKEEDESKIKDLINLIRLISLRRS